MTKSTLTKIMMITRPQMQCNQKRKHAAELQINKQLHITCRPRP